MSAAHLHLLVVHLPVVGCPLVLVLLVAAHRWRNDQLFRLAYGLLTALALAAVVAYYSGPFAYEQLQDELAASRPWVESHAVVARAAGIVLVVVGVLAIQALLQFWQEEPPGRRLRRAIFGLLVVAVYLLAWSAHLGGAIRHDEVRESSWSIFPSLVEESSGDVAR